MITGVSQNHCYNGEGVKSEVLNEIKAQKMRREQ